MNKWHYCLIPNCKNRARTRGLCMRCYGVANYRVKTDKTSWEELEDLGLAKPTLTEKPCNSPFDLALKAKREAR